MKTYFSLLALLAIFSACENHDIKPQVKHSRLKSVTSSFEYEEGNFQPSSQTVFVYDSDGKLSQKLYYTYDVVADNFSLFSTANFTFNGDQLEKIVETIGTSQTKTTTFEYANDQLTEIDIDDEVDTHAVLQYLENDVIEILYTHSNGRSFRYRISFPNKNIVTEQTFDDSGNLSSEIVNEFDSGINPLSLLGYDDPFFSNFSPNNKIKSQSEYYSSAFPQLVPVDYEYIYNEKNLPTQQITAYKSYPNGQTTRHMKNVFEYEN
jgi:hypothetical protein